MLYVKSGSKGKERSTRTSLIRATAFLIYTHTHTPKHLLFTSLRLHYLWGTGERHRREEERRGAKICIGAGSSGTDGGVREREEDTTRGERDRESEVFEMCVQRWIERRKRGSEGLCMQREKYRMKEGLKKCHMRERGC